MPHAVRNIRTTTLLLLAIAVMVSAISAACSPGDNEDFSVTGEVVAVVPRDIVEFESLSVIDEDGKTWEFEGGLFTGFTPSHLQEHMALGTPVKVWYTKHEDVLRVKKIEDG